MFSTLSKNLSTFVSLLDKTLEIIVGKGENAGNQYFLLFQQCFLPFQRIGVHLYHFWVYPKFNLFVISQLRSCLLAKTQMGVRAFG